MAEEYNEQRDTVIVNERDSATQPHNNTGVVVGLIVLAIVLLLLFFGRGLFGGSDGSNDTDINPTNTNTSQGQ